MESPPTVRPYDDARDAPALRACIIEHQDFHRSLEPSWPTGAAIVGDYVKYLRQQCASHDGAIMIAERSGEVAGFVCVVASTRGEAPDDPAPFAWIQDLFVRPAHRRLGIARQLMVAAESFAREHGARTLRLGVLHGNENAHGLYRERGFRTYVRVLAKDLA